MRASSLWLGPLVLALLIGSSAAGSVAAQADLPGLGVLVEKSAWRFLVSKSEQLGSLSGAIRPGPAPDAYADLAQRASDGAEFAILATGGAAAAAPGDQVRSRNGVLLVLTVEATNRSGLANTLDVMDFGLKPANRREQPWTRPAYVDAGQGFDWRVVFPPGATQRLRVIYDVSPATLEGGTVLWFRLREPAAAIGRPALPRTGEPDLLAVGVLFLALGAFLAWARRSLGWQ